MGTFTLGTPILLANGYQMTFNVAAGTCNGTITTDPTKISIALTSDGFNSSGVLGTIARTITIVSATVSGATLTCNLSEPIYNDDTSVSVTLQAAAFTDITPDTSDALGSTSVDIATTPSTLDYALHSGIHFIDPPHQRYTGTTFDLRALGLHQFGWAAVKMGITRQLAVTTDASGIVTASLQYPDTITFSGGAVAVVAPGSDLTVGAGAKVVRVFLRSGTTPAAAETATCATSTGTFTVASTAGGGETSGFATFTTRDREGSYGPATKQNVWAVTLTPPAVDRYERWVIWYPTVGDTSWDSRDLSVRAAVNTMAGDSCRGEGEIYCDPGDTLSASQKSYYVDSTFTNSADGAGTGTMLAWEFCKVVTPPSTLANVVVAIGDNSAGTQAAADDFRYNILPVGVVVYTVALTTSDTPVYGEIMTLSGRYLTAANKAALVLEYSGGVLTYALLHGTNFADTESVIFRNSNGLDQGKSATINGTPSAASTTAPASGDVVTGYSSGAVRTLDGAQIANGSDSNTGASNSPFLTMQKAMKQASTDRGDSLCDGVTIYLKRGHHRQVYAAGNEAESRDYWITITKAPGTETDNVRITRYNTASSNGNFTNFQRFYGVTLWATSCQSGVQILTTGSSGAVTGSYDRPAYWFDSCEIVGVFRWQTGNVSNWATSNSPYYQAFTNCRATRCQIVGHLYRDCHYRTFGNDLYTQGRCIINCSDDDVMASLTEADLTGVNSTDFHCDAWQGQQTENGNVLLWGIHGINRGYFQNAPFMNGSSGTFASLGCVNMLQSADATANISQLGNASGAGTITFSAVTFVDCTNEDGFAWRANAVGRNLTVVNLRVSSSIWTTHTKTETGTITGIYPGCYRNNHFVTSPSNNGLTDTTTTTFTDLFVSTTDDDAGFLVPKASSVALDRDLASERPNGWPTLDVFGRLRSTDAAAQGAIGAAQPIGTLTVTYDGDSMSDGGTVTETAGTKSLVMSAASGITGSVVYISDVALGGTVTGTDASPYTLTSGGATQSATISTSLTAGAATVDITYDLGSIFDFDITGQSAGGGVRSRTRIRAR